MHGRIGDKGAWVLVLFILVGIVLGGAIGALFQNVPYMGWLDYGKAFGIKEPFTLDLSVLRLSLQFTLEITIAGIIGIALAIFLFKRL